MIARFFVKYVKHVKALYRNSTIHGFQNIFKSTSILELIFWICIFTAGFLFCCVLFYGNVTAYQNQLVLQTVDSTTYPISAIPFPAVTVCNFNHVYRPRMEKIKQLLLQKGIDPEVVDQFFSSLSLLKAPQPIKPQQFSVVYDALNELGYGQLDLMRNLAQPCEKLLKHCQWAGMTVDCMTLFQESFAYSGICCSFNNFFSSFDPKIVSDINNNGQEYFAPSGPLLGMYLTLDTEIEEYVSSVYNSIAVMAYVHDKEDYPSDSGFFATIEPGMEVFMKLHITVHEIEEDLRSVDIESRECLYEGEEIKNAAGLNLSNSFDNCILTCKLRAITKFCSCVPHFYPEYNNYSSLKINLGKNTDVKSDHNEVICNCLPSCSGIDYDGLMESVLYTDVDRMPNTNDSGLRVYFQNNRCMKYKSIRSMKDDALIASVGGLFGLCLGGSILSILEFVYFFFKSLILTAIAVKRNKKHQHHLYWAEFTHHNRPVFSLINYKLNLHRNELTH